MPKPQTSHLTVRKIDYKSRSADAFAPVRVERNPQGQNAL